MPQAQPVPRDRVAVAPFDDGDQEVPVVTYATLELDMRDVPDAVVRVLVTLRRRRCEITQVDYAAADSHRPGWLRIGLRAPTGSVSSVASWIENVVDVTGVRMTVR